MNISVLTRQSEILQRYQNSFLQFLPHHSEKLWLHCDPTDGHKIYILLQTVMYKKILMTPTF